MFSLLAYYALGNAPTQHNTRNFFENLGPSPSIRPPDNCSLVKMGNQASSLAIVLYMNCYVMLYKVQKTILKFRNFSKFDLCPKCLQILMQVLILDHQQHLSTENFSQQMLILVYKVLRSARICIL